MSASFGNKVNRKRDPKKGSRLTDVASRSNRPDAIVKANCESAGLRLRTTMDQDRCETQHRHQCVMKDRRIICDLSPRSSIVSVIQIIAIAKHDM
jgi:hypothetical protein